MRKLPLAAVLLFAFAAQAQPTTEPLGTVVSNLTAYSTNFNEAFSFRANSAALASTKNFSAGLYSERRFLLTELSSHALALAFPTHSGNFGLRADYSGHSLYHASVIGLAYGRKLGEGVSLGAQFLYLSQSAAGYGSASGLSFEAGALFSVAEGVRVGLSAFNPVRAAVGKEERLPAVYSAGLGWDVSPQAFVAAQLQKTEDHDPAVNAGLHFAFSEKLFARAGLNSALPVYSLGFGVLLRGLRVEATASFHPYLGATPGLFLSCTQLK